MARATRVRICATIALYQDMQLTTPIEPAMAVRMGPPPCNLEKELLGADKPAVVATDAHPASARRGVTLASLLTYT